MRCLGIGFVGVAALTVLGGCPDFEQAPGQSSGAEGTSADDDEGGNAMLTVAGDTASTPGSGDADGTGAVADTGPGADTSDPPMGEGGASSTGLGGESESGAAEESGASGDTTAAMTGSASTGEPEPSPYHVCDPETKDDCGGTATCLYRSDVGLSVCAESNCVGAEECPDPPEGSAVACGAVAMSGTLYCHLTCTTNTDCPSGAECYEETLCAFPYDS